MIIYCQNIHNNEVTVEVDGGELIIEVSDSWGYQSARVQAKEFFEALQKGLS